MIPNQNISIMIMGVVTPNAGAHLRLEAGATQERTL
jgi:hypothetical protein